MKRIISFIMSVVMIFSMLPMEALAAAVDGDPVYRLGDVLWIKENETPTEALEEGLTWIATEQTELRSELTCQLNPHVHEDNCPVDEAGNYTCGGHIHTEDCMGKVYACVEHTHDDSCKNSGYICGAEAHVHDADCEACTLEEHSHSADCLSCGLEVHSHTGDCETVTYGCGLEGSEEHTHSEECAPSVSYTCGLEAHAHDDGCYGCGLDEHVHTADCEACTLEEHEHTEACVDDSYICGKEEHTHSEDCKYSEEPVCGEEEHIHATDGCGVVGNYTCGLEAHDHDDSCYTPVTYVKWEVAEIKTETLEGEEPAGGLCGENASWEILDGVLTITGTGTMGGFMPSEGNYAPWIDQADSITAISVGEGITEIYQFTFTDLPKVRTISLPSTLAANGFQAFSNLPSLETFIVEEGNETFYVENGALLRKDTDSEAGTTEIVLVRGPSVTSGDTYYIPGVTVVGYGSLSGSNHKNVMVPATAWIVEPEAFGDCPNLTSITFDYGMRTVLDDAFVDSTALETITFRGDAPNLSVPRTEGEDIFSGSFHGLSDVTIAYTGTNANWDDVAGNSYGGTNITWVDEAPVDNTCGENATWAIADGVLTISGTGVVNGYNPFDEDTSNDAPWASQADSITKVVVEEGITKMGNHALTYLSSAESYELPSTLTDLDFGNFTGTSSLTVVTIPDSNPAYKAVNNLVIERESETLIAVPAGLTGSIVVPDGVTAIRSDAFALCHDQAVHLPNSLNEIQDGAFVQAKNMSLYFYVAPPETLGEEMFMMADGITVRYPYIEPWYQNAETLMVNYGGTNITWESATSGATGANVFWEIKDGVLRFSVQDTAQSGIIGGYMAGEGHYSPWFEHRDSITAIEIGEGITEIGFFAFDGLGNVKTVSIPASLNAPQKIGYGCFAGLTGLERFTVAEGNTAFSAMNGALVLTVTGPGGTETVMFRAPTTASFTIPEGLNVITQFSMAGSKLTSLQIPDSVYLIEPNAFAGSTSLTSVTIAGEPDILDDAFIGCSSLDTITFTGEVPSLSAPRTEDGETYSGSFHGLSDVTIFYPGNDDAWTNIANKPYGGSSIVWRKPAGCGDNAGWKVEDGVLTIFGTGAVEDYNPFDQLTSNDAPWTSQAASITRVVVEEGITKMGNHALAKLPNVTHYDLPSSLTDLDFGNFSWNTSLTSISIPESNPAYMAMNNMVIEKESGMLIAVPAGITGSIVVPGNVTGVRSDAFVRCHDLEVHFQNGVKEVQSGAFVEAKNLVVNFLGLPPETLGEEMFMMADGITVRYPYFINWYGSAETLFKDYGGTNITWKSLDHGGCGESAQFAIKEGVLTITGTGAMGGYMPSEGFYAPWKEYADTITAISVGEGITSIYQLTFTDLPNVKTISLPSTLTEVGWQCFSGVPSLETFIVAEGNETFYVENGALLMDTVDTETNEPEIILVRGPSITSGDTYYIPGVTVVGYGSLSGSAHNHIKVPATAWLVEPEAFGDCLDLVSVTFDYGMESILDAAFEDSTVQTIRFLGNAPSLSSSTGGGSFYGTENVNIIYPGADTTWKNVINKSYGGKNVTWEPILEGHCGQSIEWWIEDGVLQLTGSGASFDYLDTHAPWYSVRSSITSVFVEEGITGLGAGLLADLPNVTYIGLPSTLTKVGHQCFRNLPSLEGFGVSGNDVYRVENGALLQTYTHKDTGNQETALIQVPAGITGEYNIPEGVTVIGFGAMTGSKASFVTLPDSVWIIEAEAFSGMQNTHIVLSTGLNNIQPAAFKGLKNSVIDFIVQPPEFLAADMLSGANTVTLRYPYIEPWYVDAADVIGGSFGGKYIKWEALNHGGTGENARWELNNGVLTFSAVDYNVEGPFGIVGGYMASEGHYAPWYPYRNSITSIVVEEGISHIGFFAFDGLSKVKTVSLPASFNKTDSVGYGAFAGLTGLESITVAEDNPLYSVMDGALVMTVTGEGGTETVMFRAPVTAGFTIPEGVNVITQFSMAGSKVTKVTIPDSVYLIEPNAFLNCTSLTNVTFGLGVNTILDAAFYGCSKLTSLTFQGNPPVLAAPGEYGGCFDGLGSITINYPATKPWADMQKQSFGATKATWKTVNSGNCGEYRNGKWSYASGVLTISGTGVISNPGEMVNGEMVYEGTTPWFGLKNSITSVVVKEGVTGLGHYLLAGLDKVTTITLPKSMTEYHTNTYANMPSLKTFKVTSGNPKYKVSGGALLYVDDYGDYIDTTLVRAPVNVTGTYSIPKGVTRIGFGALDGCKASQILIPDTVGHIDPYVFTNCVNLTELTIPASVSYISDYAFFGTNLKEIYFRCAPLSYWGEQFAGLKDLNVYYTMDPAWDAAPKDSHGGINVTWYRDANPESSVHWRIEGDTLRFFGQGPIYGFEPSNEIYSPWSARANEIKHIVVEEGITEIGFNAFHDLVKASSVSLPQSLTRIGFQALADCVNVSEYTFPNGNMAYRIENNAIIQNQDNVLVRGPSGFSGGTYWVPYGVNVIGYGAFLEAQASGLMLPDTVTLIEPQAFKGMANLTEIIIPASVETILDDAFRYTGIQSIYFQGESVNLSERPEDHEGGSFREFEGTNLYHPDTESWTEISKKDYGELDVNWIIGGAQDDIRWNVRDGKLTFSGTGEIPSYGLRQTPWFGQQDNITAIVVGEGVTGLGSMAFSELYNVETISLPATLTDLGEGNFSGLYALEEVTIAAGNESFTFANGMLTGAGTLYLIPAASTGEFTIPAGIKTIHLGAMEGCQDITVNIPADVKYIMAGAFADTENITLVFQGDAPQIHDYAFNGATGASIGYPYNANGWDSIRGQTFGGEEIRWYYADVTNTCGDNALWIYEDRTLTILGTGLVDANPWLAENLDITKVVVEEGITGIYTDVLNELPNVTEIYLPYSLTELGHSNFMNTSQQTVVCFENGSKVYWTDGTSLVYMPTRTLTHVLPGAPKSYQVPENVLNIGEFAFASSWVTDVVVPGNVKTLEPNAFGQCDTLQTVDLSGSAVAEIPMYGFAYSSNLTSVVLNGNFYSIGDYAFAGCESLNTIETEEMGLPYEATVLINVGYIGDRAFESCENLNSLLLSGGLQYLGEGFIAESGVTRVIFAGERPELMSDYVFAYAPNLSVYTDPWVESWSDEYKLSYRDEGETKTTTYYNGFSLVDDDIHWILKEGVLTITGTGELTTLDLLGIQQEVHTVIVSGDITSVDKDIFKGMSNVTKIVLSEKVKSFDPSNISGLTALETITFGGVTDIAAENGLIIQNGNTVIGTLNTGKNYVEIPQKITSIPANAFANSTYLEEIVIHTTSAMKIDNAAFAPLNNLQDIIFTGDAPEFQGDTYEGIYLPLLYPYGNTTWDTYVQNITDKQWMPSGYRDDSFIWFFNEGSGELLLMGEGIMSDFSESSPAPWSSLPYTSVIIDDRQIHIGDYAFYGSTIYGLTIPDSVTSIGKYAFANCSNIGYQPLPTGLTEIGEGAFSGCTDLYSLSIGDKVTSIGKHAFYGNSSLELLSIPASAKIGEDAFEGCAALWDITVTPGNNNGIMLDHESDYQYLPWNEADWNENNIGTVTLAPGVKTVGSHAFYQTDYYFINIGKVEAIGNYAFYESVYSELNLPDTLKTIGEKAFMGSPLRYTLKVPASVTEIGDFAFASSGVRSIELPEGMTVIPTGLFSSCELLESVKLPSTITEIGEGAFARTELLRGVTFPVGLKTIGESAFQGSGINNLSLPNTVETIGMNAFAFCEDISVVTIPESVREIGDYAFLSLGLADYSINMLVIKHHDASNPLNIGDGAFDRNSLYNGVHFHGSRWEWDEGVTLGTDTGIYPDSVTYSSDVVPVEQIHILDTNGKFGTKGAALDGQVIEVNLNKMSSVTLTAQVLPENADYNRIEWCYGADENGNSTAVRYDNPSNNNPIGTWKTSGKNLTLTNLVPGEMTVQIQNRPKNEDDPNRSMYTWATASVRLKFIRPITKIAISGDYSGYLPNNSGNQLTAKITPTNATNKYVKWSVENVTGEAKLTDTGWIITYKPGTIIVRAEAPDGSGVVAEKTIEIVEYGLDITSADSLASGKSMTLKASFLPQNLTKTSIVWNLYGDEEALKWVTLKGSTLTAKKGLTEPVTITVEATAKDNYANGDWQDITIYPIATKVEIESGNTDTKGVERSQINLNVHNTEGMEFMAWAKVLPDNANFNVKWTTTDTKNAYAKYEMVDNQIRVYDLTGKTGKVTLTATAADGSGKKDTLVLNFINLPDTVQIMRSGATEPIGDEETVELSNGNTLTLTTDIAKDKALTHKTVIWEVAEESAAYATITSAGKLTVRNVGSVTDGVIVRAKVNVAHYSDFAPEYIVDEIALRLYPTAQQVQIVKDGEALANNAKITADLFDGEIDFDVMTYPEEVRNVGTWTVSNKKVATIDQDGILTPLTNGTVTVKYAAGDGSKKTAQVSLTIQKLADTVTVAGKKAGTLETVMNEGLRGGKYIDLKADVLAADGSYAANKSVTWTVSDKNVASVSTSGRVTAKTVTRNTWVTITATAKDGSGVSDSVDILIRPKSAETVTMNFSGENATGKTYTVDLNEIETVNPSLMVYISDPNATGEDGTPADGDLITANSQATWTSSNSKIAKSEGNGKFTLLKAGTVTISAKYGKTTVKFNLKVVNLMTGLNLTTKNDVNEVRSGKTLQITAKPENNPTNKSVTWTTSDKTVATVSTSGKVTAKSVKVNSWVTITATAKDGSGIAASMDILVRPAKDQTLYLVPAGIEEADYVANVVSGKTQNVYTVENGAELNLKVVRYDSVSDEWSDVEATWTTTNTKNAENLGDGAFNLKTTGTYTISAKVGTQTLKYTAKVLRLVNGVEIISSNGKDYLAAGTSLQLTGKVLNNPSNKSLTWTSSDTSVATVSTSGKVTAKKVYDMHVVTITATAKDISSGLTDVRQTAATFDVIVYPAATSVEILESTLGKPITNLTIEKDMAVNDTFSVEALVHPYSFEDFEHQFGASQEVTWKSSNNAVAKWDQEIGAIRMLKDGTVTITATTTDGSKKSASFKLKVVHSVPGIQLLNEVNNSEELEIKGGTKLTLKLEAETFDKFPTSKVSFKLNDYGAKSGATISSTGVITTKRVTTPVPVDIIITEKANTQNQWTFKMVILP